MTTTPANESAAAATAPTDALTTPATTPVTNPTIAAQLAHRTIRAYTSEPVGEDVVETLLDVARHAATSSFQQQVTVIRVKDPAVREQLHLASGQPYVGGDAGELFVFVVDLHRNAVIRERAGASLEPLERTTLFLQGVEDAVIAAQNVVVAAESLGLGTVYLGSIIGDVRRVITALGLPQRTYPLLGLLVGHAAQEPQYKPRLPREIVTAVDTYPDFDAHADALAAYDAEVEQYYDLRDTNNRVDSFTTQIARALGGGPASQAPVLDVLHEQLLCLH
ncbi:NADPH-dependent oxidoreductase [Actinomyces ruminis]|uniref:NADPH-dependent oxidoreductase n=1 Tax=Actinomyces ruminis TaxID=1937003 RepID=A0ABX4MG55_9ACTO|nr:NADPH-dependent oxidoreductase [Actinomyces ruminis]PHP53109.1 NADPH-dependent oxidoreductase [Actinomyces ruminis]